MLESAAEPTRRIFESDYSSSSFSSFFLLSLFFFSISESDSKSFSFFNFYSLFISILSSFSSSSSSSLAYYKLIIRASKEDRSILIIICYNLTTFFKKKLIFLDFINKAKRTPSTLVGESVY